MTHNEYLTFHLEWAKQWLLRQPVQSPDAAERAREDAQLVVEAYEIITALVWELERKPC